MVKLIARLRTSLAKRRAFNRAVVEIAQLNARELLDMNIDRDTLILHAHRQVYGVAH